MQRDTQSLILVRSTKHNNIITNMKKKPNNKPKTLTFPSSPHGQGRWKNSSCMQSQSKDIVTGNPKREQSCCRSEIQAP